MPVWFLYDVLVLLVWYLYAMMGISGTVNIQPVVFKTDHPLR